MSTAGSMTGALGGAVAGDQVAFARIVAAYHADMMYDAFNGPGHDLDPTDKGYVGPDGAHLNDAGRAMQVDVIDALGYEPVDR